MRKNILKKIFCVMMSSVVMSQGTFSMKSQALTKDKVLEFGKKSMPYVVGIGIPAIVAVALLTISLKPKDGSKTAAGDNTDDKPKGIAAEEHRARVIDKCINNGELPGLDIYYIKGYSGCISCGYVVKDEPLARQFLITKCLLVVEDVDVILKSAKLVNRYFDYKSEKNNPLVGYHLFWAYFQRAVDKKINNVDKVSPKKVEQGPSTQVPPKKIEQSSSADRVEPIAERTVVKGEQQSKDVSVDVAEPNEKIAKKIKEFMAIGNPEGKYGKLYGNLRMYGKGELIGDTEWLKNEVDNAVHDGIIPGLALLRFHNMSDLWIKRAGSSTWHGYKIVDRDVFNGYLRVRTGCTEQSALEKSSEFMNQECKLFLYNDGYVMSVANYFKKKGIGLVNKFMSWFGYKDDQKTENTYVSEDFLKSDMFKVFSNDFSMIRMMNNDDPRKFNGTIDFSEFRNLPVNPKEIEGYEGFLRACDCICSAGEKIECDNGDGAPEVPAVGN